MNNHLVIKLLIINALFAAGSLVILPQKPVLFGFYSLVLIVWLLITIRQSKQKEQRITRLMSDGLLSLYDGDFAVSLPDKVTKEQSQLVELFNQVAEKLRKERQSLYQRELMLDKVVNASNVITLLVDHRNQLVFVNLAAKHFFDDVNVLGQPIDSMLEKNCPSLLNHLATEQGIIQLKMAGDKDLSGGESNEGIEQSFHLSQHALKLHGMTHRLILLKPITQALYRQELVTWKKVIRVINHELNNSIAPISSMCHSGKLLAEKLDNAKLQKVFDTITNRVNKLSQFVQSYSQLARVSSPVRATFSLASIVEQLREIYPFEWLTPDRELLLHADQGQIEQLLINLLKNAKEASEQGSSVAIPQLSYRVVNNRLEMSVRDFGSGMNEELLTQAFLPYFSTKESGSGIGLTVCRDIVEVHGGHIHLANHSEGGLVVSFDIPMK